MTKDNTVTDIMFDPKRCRLLAEELRVTSENHRDMGWHDAAEVALEHARLFESIADQADQNISRRVAFTKALFP